MPSGRPVGTRRTRRHAGGGPAGPGDKSEPGPRACGARGGAAVLRTAKGRACGAQICNRLNATRLMRIPGSSRLAGRGPGQRRVRGEDLDQNYTPTPGSGRSKRRSASWAPLPRGLAAGRRAQYSKQSTFDWRRYSQALKASGRRRPRRLASASRRTNEVFELNLLYAAGIVDDPSSGWRWRLWPRKITKT